jgi:hypothetical protein
MEAQRIHMFTLFGFPLLYHLKLVLGQEPHL